MKSPPERIAKYYRHNHLLPDETIDRLEYTLKTLFNELSKFLLFLLIFSLCHLADVYLTVYLCFISVRFFAGGIHCKTYWGCFTVSLAMIGGCVGVAHISSLSFFVLWVLAAISTILPLLLSPVTPSFRMIKNPKKIWILKILAFFLSWAWISVATVSLFSTVSSRAVLLSVCIANYQLIIPKTKLFICERRGEG